MAGGPVSWSSKRQQTVALSTTEAEYMGITRGSQQSVWMYSFMDEIGLPQKTPGPLRGNNLGSISLTRNTKGHSRVKHINIRHHYVRERVEKGDIEVTHIPSTENIADILTKPLVHAAHHSHVLKLGLAPHPGK